MPARLPSTNRQPASNRGTASNRRTASGRLNVNDASITIVTPPDVKSGAQVIIQYNLISITNQNFTIVVEFKKDHLHGFAPATPGVGGDGTTNISGSPSPGNPHTYSWDTTADGVGSPNVDSQVQVRITPVQTGSSGESATTGDFIVDNTGGAFGVLQTITGGLTIPNIPIDFGAMPAYLNQTLNASGKKLAFVFKVPKSGSIRSIGFRTQTVTTGDTMKIGIYTTDPATGVPTATAYGGMTTVTQVIADVDDNVWFTVQLGTDATAVIGDLVAVVIEFNSFVAGNLQLVMSASQAGTIIFPYPVFNNGVSWTQQNTGVSVAYIKYSDGSVAYIPNMLPFSNLTQQAFRSDTSPDEYALKFQLPFPSRVAGVYGPIGFTQNSNIILYDSDGTSILISETFNFNYAANNGLNRFSYRFSVPANISKNTFYRLSFQATGTVNNVLIPIFTVPEAVAMDQLEGGQNFILSSRTDLGAWSDVTTQRPAFSLLLDQFNDGS